MFASHSPLLHNVIHLPWWPFVCFASAALSLASARTMTKCGVHLAAPLGAVPRRETTRESRLRGNPKMAKCVSYLAGLALAHHYEPPVSGSLPSPSPVAWQRDACIQSLCSTSLWYSCSLFVSSSPHPPRNTRVYSLSCSTWRTECRSLSVICLPVLA